MFLLMFVSDLSSWNTANGVLGLLLALYSWIFPSGSNLDWPHDRQGAFPTGQSGAVPFFFFFFHFRLLQYFTALENIEPLTGNKQNLPALFGLGDTYWN